mmetsp:Transcript_37849/g.88476  ORF Transcript_37849/g.88476 Transcript_37849/m.88476 type:complete len:375 (+) Transcript_37849:56-1180(+)
MSLAGTMPPQWVAAILVSVSISAFTVTGFVIQSLELRDPEKWKRYPRFGEVVLSPRWIFGFVLQTFPNFFGDIISYALAPLSLLAPLSGVAVALNTSIAPWMLGEKLQLFPDIPATGLILVGVVVTSMTGAHKDQVDIAGIEMLEELLKTPLTMAVFAGLALSLVAAFAIEEMGRAYLEDDSDDDDNKSDNVSTAATSASEDSPKRQRQQQQQQPKAPDFDASRVPFVLLAAWLAAGTGCVTNISIKILSEVLKAPGQEMLAFAALLAGVVPAAILQQQAINKGLRLYPQTVFFPIYSSLLMLANTFFGAVFFDEFIDGLLQGSRGVMFTSGLILIISGIFLFGWRRSPRTVENDALNECLLQAEDIDNIKLPA